MNNEQVSTIPDRLPAPLIRATANGDTAGTAVEWASFGVSVLPLFPTNEDRRCACGKGDCRSPGKHPITSLTPKGLLDATIDPLVVREWAAVYPDFNLGLVMGESLIAVDLDPRHGADMAASFGPPTLTERTGSGGDHRLYRLPAGVRARSRDIAAGTEIKAAGTYIATSPSLHESGRRYAWIDPLAPIAIAPPSLIETPRARGQEGRGNPSLMDLPPAVWADADWVIQSLLNGPMQEPTRRLLAGDLTGCPSPSEADFSLAELASFWTRDRLVIRAILLKSKLVREKWFSHAEYLDITIASALARRVVLAASVPGHVLKWRDSSVAVGVSARVGSCRPTNTHTAHPDNMCIDGNGDVSLPKGGGPTRRAGKVEVAAGILRFLNLQSTEDNESAEVRLPVGEIAETFGVTRRTVCNALHLLIAQRSITATTHRRRGPRGVTTERTARLAVSLDTALDELQKGNSTVKSTIAAKEGSGEIVMLAERAQTVEVPPADEAA